MSRDESSANKLPDYFVLYVRWQIIYKYAQKSRSPRILPCRTPDCMIPTADIVPFAQTCCDLSDRYDWKKRMTDELFKYTLLQDCVVY